MKTYQCAHCGHTFKAKAPLFAPMRACEIQGCPGWGSATARRGVWRFMHFTTLPRPFGEPGVYMHRLQFVETPWFSARLHIVKTHDEDKHEHDHPFGFVSFLLWGWYDELRGSDVRRVRWFNWCPTPGLHRIIKKSKRPTVTLVFTTGRHRGWGYQMEDRWVPWRDYKEMQRGGLV